MSRATPEQLRAEAAQADSGAEGAASGEYPRYGRAVYTELGQALRALADVTEETEGAGQGLTNRRERRQAVRAARLKRKAAYLRVEALRTDAASHHIAERRPFGQPIIVGHHSEGSHRNDIGRMHRMADKSMNLRDAAAEAARQAKAAEHNRAIYSDDEDAVTKLEAKLKGLEARRDRRKAINAAWRKAGRPGPADTDAWQKMADLIGESLADLEGLRHDCARSGMGRPQPYQPYTFQNLGANIRRIKQRIEQQKQRAEAAERPERAIGDVRIVDNLEFHKVELHFPGKPDEKTRRELKAWGFRWIRSAGCWARSINTDTEARLGWLAEHLGQPLTGGNGDAH
jgi:hypothetical protein